MDTAAKIKQNSVIVRDQECAQKSHDVTLSVKPTDIGSVVIAVFDDRSGNLIHICQETRVR